MGKESNYGPRVLQAATILYSDPTTILLQLDHFMTGFAVGAFAFQALGFAAFAQVAPKVQMPVKLITTEEAVVTSDVKHTERLGPAPVSAWTPQCPMDFKGEKESKGEGPHGMKRVSRFHISIPLKA